MVDRDNAAIVVAPLSFVAASLSPVVSAATCRDEEPSSRLQRGRHKPVVRVATRAMSLFDTSRTHASSAGETPGRGPEEAEIASSALIAGMRASGVSLLGAIETAIRADLWGGLLSPKKHALVLFLTSQDALLRGCQVDSDPSVTSGDTVACGATRLSSQCLVYLELPGQSTDPALLRDLESSCDSGLVADAWSHLGRIAGGMSTTEQAVRGHHATALGLESPTLQGAQTVTDSTHSPPIDQPAQGQSRRRGVTHPSCPCDGPWPWDSDRVKTSR